MKCCFRKGTQYSVKVRYFDFSFNGLVYEIVALV